MAKRMRLPNGFGQISKLKKPLRKPYRAMVSIGVNPKTGHPISKTVGYYKTYNDAYAALMEYHKNPYDLTNQPTMQELYERWYEYKSKFNYAEGTFKLYKHSWSACSSIKNILVREFRTYHVRELIDSLEMNSLKCRVKILLSMMLDYAVEYEMTDRNYVKDYKLPAEVHEEIKDNARSHISFTEDELNILWKHVDDPYVRVMLIDCYTGFRPQELLTLKTENISLENLTITGGMKTRAGKNRVVPINEKIKGLVKEAYSSENEYLFNFNYDHYRRKLTRIVSDLGLNPEHRPHDCRKTFVTLCKKYKVDEYAIKRLVGHSIGDITEEVYTDRDVEWLREEIAKI